MSSKHSQLKKSLSDIDSFYDCQPSLSSKVSKALNRLLKVLIIVIRVQSHSVEALPTGLQKNHTHRPVPVVSIASSASAQTCCHTDAIGKERTFKYKLTVTSVSILKTFWGSSLVSRGSSFSEGGSIFKFQVEKALSLKVYTYPSF